MHIKAMQSQSTAVQTTETSTDVEKIDLSLIPGSTNQEKLIHYLTPLLEQMGFELVHLELEVHRGKVLRIFIDFLTAQEESIGVEDCVRVTRALDLPLEAFSNADKTLSSGYELEVSSPGVDRPLRKANDYSKFAGREVRIHLFRPATADEMENAEYFGKNPKQKNYLGILKGLENQKIVLDVPASMGSVLKNKSPKKKNSETFFAVKLPLTLVSKANLEPDFNSFVKDE